MKKQLLTTLLLAFTLALSAQYRVNKSGTNSQTSKTFRTLAYAANIVSSGTIYVDSGSYTETVKINLKEGVNIDGAGANKVSVLCNFNGEAISLISSVNGDGNQFIRNITLDGNKLTGKTAILVKYRNNVQIYNCNIKDFEKSGILFYGSENSHSTGNKVYNCSITNCADRAFDPSAHIFMQWQKQFEIGNCIFDQIQRPAGHNGDIIRVPQTAQVEDIKIHDNKFTKPDDEAGQWNFSIEAWANGGWEINNNEFFGGGQQIDVGSEFSVKGSYPYSFWIHDNKFSMTTQKQTDANKGSEGVDIERGETVIIENNHFVNLGMGIELNSSGIALNGFPGVGIKNITIRNNIFENMGYSISGWSPVITLVGDNTNRQEDIFVLNNIIVNSGAAGKPIMGVFVTNNGDVNNLQVKNNIFMDIVERGYIALWGNNINNLTSQNNIIFNCANSNKIYRFGTSITTGLIENNNIMLNPLFISKTDFHLTSGSPGKFAGQKVDNTKDFSGNLWNNPPSIGVYEFGIVVPPPPPPPPPVVEIITIKIPVELKIGTKLINTIIVIKYNTVTKEVVYE